MHTREEVKEENRKTNLQNRVGRAINYLDMEFYKGSESEGHVISIRIRGPRWADDDVMLVAQRKADDGTPQVCFQTGVDLLAVLVGFSARLRNGSAKWVTDKYAKPDQE